MLKVELLEKNFLNQEEKVNQQQQDMLRIFDFIKKLLGTGNPDQSKIGFKTA